MLLSDTPYPLEISNRRARLEHPASTVVDALPQARRTASSLAERVRIEPAGLRDWYSICAMIARNFPLETEKNLGYWLCHQLPYFRVARIDGEVAGFMHAQPRPDTGTLWVNMLAVDERFRNQGVAHRMVEHFETVCRDWHCQNIGLQCLTSNVAALNLYERQGYARLSETTTELGMQVVVHRKTLPVSDAPRISPRPEVALDGRPMRLLYRMYYLAWFRSRTPMPR
ncbi:MAG: GNAT family N-acetyltransferase [Sphaerotilus sp.]|nr:GNAT family N-acetyltransferase [Sphaerotilus sp.]